MTRANQSDHGLSERDLVGKTKREVVQARAVWWRCLHLARPRVQRDMMVIVAGGEKRGLLVLLRDVQAEDVAIELQRPLEVGHGQVDMPDIRSRVDRSRCCVDG